MAQLNGLIINDTGNLTLPVGNDATRPTSTSTVVNFTNVGTTTWTCPAGVTNVEVLVVAGGGAGGNTQSNSGAAAGGGGAGGLIYNSAYSVTPGTTYTVTVGAGGPTNTTTGVEGSNGSNSVFDKLIAIGGGGGGADNTASVYGSGVPNRRRAKDGGSGGGAGAEATQAWMALGTPGQGNNGGVGGDCSCGGGGAGTAGGSSFGVYGVSGSEAGRGGDGLQYSISGTPVYYAGGGGGGANAGLFTRGVGGLGGGGGGAPFGSGAASNAIAGTANTGGGGGGGAANQGNQSSGGAGGSGVVILRYVADSSNQEAQVRFNTTRNSIEKFKNTEWIPKDNIETDRSLVMYLDPAYYSSGTTLYDLTSNGNNATLYNGANITSDNGGVMNFDGVDDYARIPISNSLNSVKNGYTLSVWFYTTVTADTMIVNNHIQAATSVGSVSGSIINTTTAGMLVFQTRINNTCCQTLGSSGYNVNQWTHVLMTYDGAIKKLYKNGFLLGTQVASGDLNMINDLFIGINADTFRLNGTVSLPFNGKIGPVRMFNRALTSVEATKEYNLFRNRYIASSPTASAAIIKKAEIVKSGLVLNLDAGDKNSYPGYGLVWNDLSGRGSQGKLVSNPTFSERGEASYFTFNGSSQYVFVGSPVPAPLNLTTGVTICAWINPAANNSGLYQIAGTQYDTGGFRGATLLLDGRTTPVGKMHFQIGNGTSWAAIENPTNAVTVATGTWTYVCATWSTGNAGRCYFNGVEDPVLYQNRHVGPISNVAGSEFSIGRQSDAGRYFNGSIACVQVYNRALSPGEIDQNFQATRNRYGK